MTEAIDRFVFDGKIYYQQWRKCGRQGCGCQSGRQEDLHRPHWYWKFQEGVGTKYLGKRLPPHVSEARERYKELGKQIEDSTFFHRVRWTHLEKLIEQGTLLVGDLEMLKRWGLE